MDSLMTKKRQQIFQILENKKAQIILLQEKHFNSQLRKKGEKKWNDLSFWHSGKKTKYLGVVILFQKQTKIEPTTITKDEDGRILSLKFIFEKQIFQTINIFAQTNPLSRNNFYKNLLNHINKNNKQNLILAGDFNMVEGLYLDRQGGTPSNLHLIG